MLIGLPLLLQKEQQGLVFQIQGSLYPSKFHFLEATMRSELINSAGKFPQKKAPVIVPTFLKNRFFIPIFMVASDSC